MSETDTDLATAVRAHADAIKALADALHHIARTQVESNKLRRIELEQAQ